MIETTVIGTWDLVSYELRVLPDGEASYPLGESPRGILIYAPDGSMAVCLEATDRPAIPWRNSEIAHDLKAAAYDGFLSYFGTFEVVGDTVLHHIAISSVPTWDNIEQVRQFAIDGDRLVLSVEMQGRDRTSLNTLVWTRRSSDSKP